MNTARPRVVVGVDGSRASHEAVVHAAWEADRRALSLRMVHAYVLPTPCLTPLPPLFDENLMSAVARDQLAEAAQVVRSKYPYLPLETKAVRAFGSVALVQESATARLVVIGAPRLGGRAWSPAGPVATQIMASARCPVLVVPPSLAVPPPVLGAGPVLVGVDGYAPSEPVLSFAFDEAAVRGESLVAVHVWSVPELTGLGQVTSGVQWARNPDQAQLQVQENAERILAEALAGWQERYPQVRIRRWVVHNFDTGQVLLDAANEVAAGLIVVGSRGRGTLAGTMLGSVSQSLISHAVAPIAVIGPLADPRQGVDRQALRVPEERVPEESAPLSPGFGKADR